MPRPGPPDLADDRPAEALADAAADEGGKEVPAELAAHRPGTRASASWPLLRVWITMSSPTVQQHHASGSSEIAFLMIESGEILHVVHVVVEPDDLERLQLERHLVDDAGQAVAGPDERQQLGILAL